MRTSETKTTFAERVLGWFGRTRQAHRKSRLVRVLEQQALLASAVGLGFATHEREKQLEQIMSGAGMSGPAAGKQNAAVYIKDGGHEGQLVQASHKLDTTSSMLVQPDPQIQAALYLDIHH